MGVKPYKVESSKGNFKTLYMVVAEGINKHTGRRVQKKRRGVESKPKAQMIYMELWNACREERIEEKRISKWSELVIKYREHVDSKKRSELNPYGFSPHTVRCKHSRLTHTKIWNERLIEDLTPISVNRDLDAFELDGMSRANTNELLREIKCVFAFGLDSGFIVFNRFAGTRMRKMPKKRLPALNHEEVGILLREAKNRNHPYYYIWLLTIVFGLRRSELAGLKWSDIDFEQGLIHLQRQLSPHDGMVETLKDWEDRLVAIPKHILPVLREMKLAANTDFVIEIDCGHWRDGNQAFVLRTFCREIGIRELTHHRLRATHITLALADNVPLAVVKENVGHAQLSTTDRYFSASGLKMKGQINGWFKGFPGPESQSGRNSA